MTLLQQTIQEYLNEHHPNWEVKLLSWADYVQGQRNNNIYQIFNKTDTSRPRAYIYTETKTITYHTGIDHKATGTFNYTKHTILQQITHAIS